MQKIIKRTALLLALALAMVCMGLFASACGDAKEYTVTVYYADGTLVDGTKDDIEVQICADVENGFCYSPNAKVDANGVAKFDIADVDSKAEKTGFTDKRYVIHLWAPGNEALTLKEGKVTVDAKNASVKVTLADRNAK